METDAEGWDTLWFHDLEGRPTRVSRSVSDTTYQYDDGGLVVRVADPNGNSSDYSRDDRGRVIEIRQTDDGVRTLQTVLGYDLEGRTASVRDAAGNLTQFQVDALGRVGMKRG
jgi:YD repeat-containing protein